MAANETLERVAQSLMGGGPRTLDVTAPSQSERRRAARAWDRAASMKANDPWSAATKALSMWIAGSRQRDIDQRMERSKKADSRAFERVFRGVSEGSYEEQDPLGIGVPTEREQTAGPGTWQALFQSIADNPRVQQNPQMYGRLMQMGGMAISDRRYQDRQRAAREEDAADAARKEAQKERRGELWGKITGRLQSGVRELNDPTGPTFDEGGLKHAPYTPGALARAFKDNPDIAHDSRLARLALDLQRRMAPAKPGRGRQLTPAQEARNRETMAARRNLIEVASGLPGNQISINPATRWEDRTAGQKEMADLFGIASRGIIKTDGSEDTGDLQGWLHAARTGDLSRVIPKSDVQKRERTANPDRVQQVKAESDEVNAAADEALTPPPPPPAPAPVDSEIDPWDGLASMIQGGGPPPVDAHAAEQTARLDPMAGLAAEIQGPPQPAPAPPDAAMQAQMEAEGRDALRAQMEAKRQRTLERREEAEANAATGEGYVTSQGFPKPMVKAGVDLVHGGFNAGRILGEDVVAPVVGMMGEMADQSAQGLDNFGKAARELTAPSRERQREIVEGVGRAVQDAVQGVGAGVNNAQGAQAGVRGGVNKALAPARQRQHEIARRILGQRTPEETAREQQEATKWLEGKLGQRREALEGVRVKGFARPVLQWTTADIKEAVVSGVFKKLSFRQRRALQMRMVDLGWRPKAMKADDR